MCSFPLLERDVPPYIRKQKFYLASMVGQGFLDQDKDQIVNCIFCFQLWMMLSLKRVCILHSICSRGLQDAFEGLKDYARLYDTAELAALLEYGKDGVEKTDESSARLVVKMLSQGLHHCRGVRLSEIGVHAFEPADVSAEFAGASETPTATRAFACEKPDYFVSHSWRDDPGEKYKALEHVSHAFEVQHGREPILWIDKFCIDQANINESLKFLPVFINASKQRLILHGPSYFSRLWCMWELYVMQACDPDLNRVMFLSVDNHSTSRLATELGTFDINETACFHDSVSEAGASQKARICSIVTLTIGHRTKKELLPRLARRKVGFMYSTLPCREYQEA